MDSKRKANGNVVVETDDRGSKRRKVADVDITKGETRETTTVYGYAFLEHIRRTADKSGRLVATGFEKLPSRDANPDYYKRTRMPISLEKIEEKLNNHEFETLAELESYAKRMISNAKEFYPRSSTLFDDAERLRKALSNYMTKNNPAYNTRGYQAFPTPLPPEDEEGEEDDDEEAGDEGGEEEDDGEEEEEEDDAEPEAEEDAPEEEDDDGEDEEDEEEPESRKRSIILKRRGPTRASRNSLSQAQDSPKTAALGIRPDHQYEDVPYKGLTFQQAQEKLVEELLRHTDPEYEGYYFEAFINLPPRSMKDYFKVITEPLSIKQLQKMVKGVHTRRDIPGTSNFKTWSALEDKAKLLWTNAYFYNEEGSEIYTSAQELEAFFKEHLKQAQAAAPEPTQPKIKLKVGQAPEATPTSKKITIHVGGRVGSTDSPAPQTSQSAEGSTNGQLNGTTRNATPTQSNLSFVEKARSVSISVPSPSPSVQGGLKAEDSVASPMPQPSNSSLEQTTLTPVVKPPTPVAPPQPVHNPLANGYMEQKRPRPPGKGAKDALIASLRVLHHPSLQAQNPLITKILPHPTEMQQSATINLPASQCRIVLISALPDHIQSRQYSLWTVLDKQPLKPLHQQIPGQGAHERVFEVMLHPGVNVIESHLIAAIPRSERVPGGPEVELEVFTVLVNLLRN